MFEKEAEEYAQDMAKYYESAHGSVPSRFEKYLRKAVEYGYNKANEWYDIKEIEPSKEQIGKQLLIKIESVTGDTDYDYFVYKYKGESISDVIGVIAWKEIVLPELKESE